MTLTSSSSSSSSSSTSHFLYFQLLILILPFPFDLILKLYLNLLQSCFNQLIWYLNQLFHRSQIISSILHHQFLHFLFYLFKFNFLLTEPFSISSTTQPFDSYHHSLLSSISTNTTNQPSSSSSSSKLSSYSNSRASILITNNSDHHPLALNLALEFAKTGYHVFLQVSSQSQLSQVILRWQRLKSKINKSANPSKPQTNTLITGSLIPLVYTTHHLDQRNDAISTIRAYAREESFDMISLIHIIHPQFIRQSHLQHSPINPTPIISPNISPSRSTRRLSVTSHDPIGLTSPTHHAFPSFSPSSSTVLNLNHHPSSSSPTTTFYPNHQIPISSCSESYLFDTFNDLLLGPLSHTQDFLPTLISLKGRVLHVWVSDEVNDRDDSNSLIGLGKDGVKRMVKILGSELKPFRIPVSLIFTKTKQIQKIKVFNHHLTHDVRSILTEESDPLILRSFQNQVQIKEEENSKEKKEEEEEEDQEVLLRYVKSALESQFPHELYPLTIHSLLTEIHQTLKTLWNKK